MQRQQRGPARTRSGVVCNAQLQKAPPARPASRSSSGPRPVVMRTLTLGEPVSQPGTSASPIGSRDDWSGSNSSSSSSSSTTTTTTSSNGSNGSSSNGVVLMRRPVSTLTAVQTAAAGAATSLQSREQLTELVLASSGMQAEDDRPSDRDFRWAQDSYNVTQRNVETWSFFITFRSRLWLLDQKWSYPGGWTEAKRSVRARSLARYLLESLLNLGPTFIKIGQLCSTRSDLFPAEFIEELAKLQDRVPAFSGDKAAAIVEADLGQPVSRLFRSFEMRPIAAASLGQVHRAVLHSGEAVVVKVQRPGLKQLFDIDLENLRILAEQLDKGDEARDFKGIYEECAQVLYGEIDYIEEGRNADRFRRNFRGTNWVKVPTVHWEQCSPRVLTLEYLPGVKISDAARLQAAGVDTDLVARRATESYLTQLLTHGFFHADPHPGNVAVDVSSENGALVYYDFGMMGGIVPDVRERLLDLFYSIYREDGGGAVRALVELGVITPQGDMLSVRRAINYFITNIKRQTERQETIGAIGEDLFAIALDQPFRFPATFTFVLRAFSTLEGIGKQLTPNYNFSEVATPYAQELLSLQDGRQAGGAFLINQLQQQASEVTAAAAAMPSRVARIDSTLEQLETGNLKLRVRVLEGERAARRAGVMQVATINTVAAAALLDVGTQLALHGGLERAAAACYSLSLVFGVLVTLGLRRIKNLDKFEREIKGGGAAAGGRRSGAGGS